MIAIAGSTPPAADKTFLELLPAITAQTRRAFARLTSERREEAVQSAVADAYAAFVRLVELGKQDLAYATPLAQFAIRRYRCGRRFGARLNTFDVLSPYRRCGHVCRVESLKRYAAHENGWREAVVEDRRAGPAETAAARLDFAAWLRSLSPQRRRIARLLATVESTQAAARRLAVSAGRVSQCRRTLEASWRRFQGEAAGV